MKLYECVMGLLRIAKGIFRNGHWKLLPLCTKKSAFLSPWHLMCPEIYFLLLLTMELAIILNQ